MIKNKIQPCNIIIFGIKGDLSRRKLITSLYKLEKLKLLHKDTKIIGIGRNHWTFEDYLLFIKKTLKIFLEEPIINRIWNLFKLKLNFCTLDFLNISNYQVINEKIKKNKINICYLAIPPKILKSVILGFRKSSLNNLITRLVIEKPIGNNLKSFRKIHDNLVKCFNEKQIYRVDHYLAKTSIINLIFLRFSNHLIFSNWNNRTVDHVQITFAEKIGIENRWNYFDNVGQMRDMVQSHLLQILTIITMSRPANFTAEQIYKEKIKILESLKPINQKNVNNLTSRGQYSKGLYKGQYIPGYLEEKYAIKISNTETFVSLKVNIDNFSWRGVPFYLRTGKRLPKKCSKIVIFFKNLSNKELEKNKIVINLYPEFDVNIQILSKDYDQYNNYKIRNIKLNLVKIFNESYKTNEYERLFLEIIKGKKDLFLCEKEIEASWKWIDPIIYAWKANKNIDKYSAGTWGPQSSLNLISKDGRMWDND